MDKQAATTPATKGNKMKLTMKQIRNLPTQLLENIVDACEMAGRPRASYNAILLELEARQYLGK